MVTSPDSQSGDSGFESRWDYWSSAIRERRGYLPLAVPTGVGDDLVRWEPKTSRYDAAVAIAASDTIHRISAKDSNGHEVLRFEHLPVEQDQAGSTPVVVAIHRHADVKRRRQ